VLITISYFPVSFFKLSISIDEEIFSAPNFLISSSLEAVAVKAVTFNPSLAPY